MGSLPLVCSSGCLNCSPFLPLASTGASVCAYPCFNATPTDYTDGSFSENFASANLGLNYPFGWFGPSKSKLREGLAYIQLNGRVSDETRGTYGGSVGLRLNF